MQLWSRPGPLGFLCAGLISLSLMFFGLWDREYILSFYRPQSETGGSTIPVFFSFGGANSFNESQSLEVKPSVEGRYEVALPDQVARLRLDPLDRPGEMEICEIRLKNSLGMTVLEWQEGSQEKWSAAGDLESMVWTSDSCVRLRSAGQDPILVTSLPSELWKLKNRKVILLAVLVGVLVFFCLSGALVFWGRRTLFLLSGAAALLLGGWLIWKFYRSEVRQSIQRTSWVDERSDHFRSSLVDYYGRPLFSRGGKYAIYLDSRTGYRAVPSLRNPAYTLNASGFRNSKETNGEVRRRVVFTGGSAAFGYGIEGDENTIPSQLVQSGNGLKVSNLGHIGYLFTQEISLAFWETSEDVVDDYVAFTGWNDFVTASAALKARYHVFYDGLSSPFVQVVQKLMQFSYRDMGSLGSKPKLMEPKDVVRMFVEKVKVFLELAKSRRARFLLVIQPEMSIRSRPSEEERRFLSSTDESQIRDMGKAYHQFADRVERGARDLGVQTLNLSQFRGLSEERETVFIDQVHLNIRGATIVSEEISRTMHRSAP